MATQPAITLVPADEPEELTIHPAAEAFPLLPEDELQELAADIRVNGLRYPIMLDSTGHQLLDGRNRLRACEMAGVEPRFDWLPEGTDAAAYIISVNIARRHLTKGQQALGLALIYPTPEKGGRGKNVAARKAAETAGFSMRRLAEARQIVRYADLTDMVKDGRMKFDYALVEAQTRQRVEDHSSFYLERLQSDAPDLAAQVRDEHLTLPEAWGAYEVRRKQAELIAQQQRARYLHVLEGFYRSTTAAANAEFLQGLQDALADPGFVAEVRQRLSLDEADRDAALQAMVKGAEALTAIMKVLL
jgi:hypothetical protein